MKQYMLSIIIGLLFICSTQSMFTPNIDNNDDIKKTHSKKICLLCIAKMVKLAEKREEQKLALPQPPEEDLDIDSAHIPMLCTII